MSTLRSPVGEPTPTTVFVWRGVLCWLIAALLWLAWHQKETHVKNALPGRCMLTHCSSASCRWDPQNLPTSCLEKYNDGCSAFEGLLIVAFILAVVEFLLAPLHAGRQAAGLNGLILVAQVVFLGTLAAFVGSAAGWAYFWFPLLGGLVYPAGTELLFFMHWHMRVPPFAGLFLAFLGGLLPFILWMADSTSVMNGWIPVGNSVACGTAFASALAVRLPAKYGPPESMTERME
ncbi:unnamed protein product [Amoebophrya sp. A25]|nr:unnamed protein product [Amoebophrya sp. A25]|eukprot:GSA25T00016241001.1